MKAAQLKKEAASISHPAVVIVVVIIVVAYNVQPPKNLGIDGCAISTLISALVPKIRHSSVRRFVIPSVQLDHVFGK